MLTDAEIIAQTNAWIKEVVIGCNFCPFAAKEMKLGRIHYEVIRSGDIKTACRRCHWSSIDLTVTKVSRPPC
jgi:hypothetical protein